MASQPPGPQSIGLPQLIDFSVQRTYHELMVLSELLPTKTDMERKIDIVRFAHKTRQLFVRLYALVKWAKNGYKIDKCMNITSYLDQQCLLYIDTANQLSTLARETLVQARLPVFSIPAAVDVLTSGTYPRLPTCIREKIVPPDPITPDQEQATLQRLSQIIEFRLITSDIPSTFKRVSVENGRLTLLVDNEFSATLTVMGDAAQLPWRLLDIEILVEDCNSKDGNPLVHTMQVQYLHTLVQSRLVDTLTPLHELYSVLHAFCQSLQLEVLFSQAQKMVHEALNSTIKIENYRPCKSLVISYWRPRNKSRNSQPHHAQTSNVTNWMYRMEIHVCEKDADKPLQIRHYPSPPSKDVPLPFSLVSNQLSLEKILLNTVHAWSNVRLKELQTRLEQLDTASGFVILDVPPTLSFCLLSPGMDYEQLRVALDCSDGNFSVSFAHCTEKVDPIYELQDYLNQPMEQQKSDQLLPLLNKIRLWLGLERCRTTVQHLKTSYSDHLPIVHDTNNQLENLPPNRMFVKIPRSDNVYVVVTVSINKAQSQLLDHKFYMMPVTPCTFNPNDNQSDVVKMFMKPGKLHLISPTDSCTDSLVSMEDGSEGLITRSHEESCYFISELIRVVCQAEDLGLFTTLAEQLRSQNIRHQGVQKDETTLTSITMLSMPSLDGEASAIQSVLLQATIRLDVVTQNWIMELLFSKHALDDSPAHHQCILSYPVQSTSQAALTVTQLLADWKAVVKLYNMCLEYSAYLGQGNEQDIQLYKYKHTCVSFSYGQNNQYLVTLTWDGKYAAAFTMINTAGQNRNPHTVTAHYLNALLNNTSTNRLALFLQVLCETISPLSTLSRLPETAAFGIAHQKGRVVPTTLLNLTAQSPTFVRLQYRQTNLLDIHMCSDGVVGIRDGAYSMIDPQQNPSGYGPTQGLKGFLSRYVEMSENRFTRKQSVQDEDAPPTPTHLAGLDTLEALLSGNPKPSSPMGKQSSVDSVSPKSQQPTGASPAVAPSPLAALNSMGSPFDIAMTSPALPLSSPAPMIAQSPANMSAVAQSPATAAAMMPSPGSFLPSQGSVDNPQSYSLTAPSPKAWANSPSTQQTAGYSPRAGTSPRPERRPDFTAMPTRTFPQRSGVASMPTYLTHAAFSKILSSNSDQTTLPTSHLSATPLERFLGSAYLKRFMIKAITTDEIKDTAKEKLLIAQNVEPGTFAWGLHSLQYKIMLDATYQMLQMCVTTVPDNTDNWTAEDLRVLEHYFNHRIACPPYKSSTLRAFCRLIMSPPRVLKDLVMIMKQQMVSDFSAKWRVELCLTFPNEVTRRNEQLITGIPAFVIQSEKVLFVLRFSRNGMVAADPQLPSTVAMALFYEMNTDKLQPVSGIQETATTPVNPLSQAITTIIKNSQQQQQAPGYHSQYTSIYSSVLDVINNLNV